MMSSGSSTDRGAARRDSSFQPWHFYILLSLAGATWAVIVSQNTHPAALILLSASIVAAGLVGAALHAALAGFFGGEPAEKAATGRTREFLEQEKALVLRSIKELEFDRAMRKISDQDFAEIGGRLRARALELMQALEGPVEAPAPETTKTKSAAKKAPTAASPTTCPACDTPVESDARFCKQCGAKL
jgi:hypothetical protein